MYKSLKKVLLAMLLNVVGYIGFRENLIKNRNNKCEKIG